MAEDGGFDRVQKISSFSRLYADAKLDCEDGLTSRAAKAYAPHDQDGKFASWFARFKIHFFTGNASALADQISYPLQSVTKRGEVIDLVLLKNKKAFRKQFKGLYDRELRLMVYNAEGEPHRPGSPYQKYYLVKCVIPWFDDTAEGPLLETMIIFKFETQDHYGREYKLTDVELAG